MAEDGRVVRDAQEVAPQLPTVLQVPAVRALVDGDDELLRALEELQEVDFFRLHVVSSGLRLAGVEGVEYAFN